MFEHVSCYLCGADDHEHFIHAQEDLTGKLGWFSFVKCRGCGLVYQEPRVDMAHIGAYYDDERWLGLQAPQHTVLFDREHLLASVRAGLGITKSTFI